MCFALRCNVLFIIATLGLLVWGATHKPSAIRHARAVTSSQHIRPFRAVPKADVPRPASWNSDQFVIDFDRDFVR